MAKPIGISFLPTDENSPQGRGQPSSLGQALEILSLRLPKVRGARGISPMVYGQGAPPGFNPLAEIIKAMTAAAQGGPVAPPLGPGGGGAVPPGPPMPGGGGPLPAPGPVQPRPGGFPLPAPPLPMPGGGGPLPPMPMPGGGMPQGPMPLPPEPTPTPRIRPGDGPPVGPPRLPDLSPGPPIVRTPSAAGPIMRAPAGGDEGPVWRLPGDPVADMPIDKLPIDGGPIAKMPDLPLADAWHGEPLPDPGGRLPLKKRGQWNEYFFS